MAAKAGRRMDAMMAEQRIDRLCLMSYNCRGVNAMKIDYINDLMTDCEILCLQEHWLLDEGLSLMEHQLKTVHVFGKSGMDAKRLLSGRPFGGCAVLVKKSLDCTVSLVNTNSRCLFSCIFQCPNGSSFLLHNVYMPTDTCHDESNNDLFNEILSEIEYVNVSHDDIDNVVIAGDLNTDLSRSASLHCASLLDFCENQDLRMCQFLDIASVDFSYMNVCANATSLIDHFIVSDALSHSVVRYECLHHGQNMSDHCPVTLIFGDFSKRISDNSARSERLRYAWHKASDIDIMLYKYTLNECLRAIELPVDVLACRGIECVCDLESINSYYHDIVNACLNAADCAIPKTGGRRRVAGWTQYVKPYKDRSILWFRMWLENGRPNSGAVYECMRKTKRDYKRVARWVLRNQEKLSVQKMADALLARRERDFWTEIKKKSKGAQASACYVDDACGDEEIGQLFSDRFNQLYNSVSFEQQDMNELLRKVDVAKSQHCSQGSCYCNHQVNARDVYKAIGSLKAAKSDICEGITSDCFIYACDELLIHIALLLNVMIVHSYAPEPFLCATIIPIPKNVRKSRNDSSNYRSIAIGNVIGKIFDKIILVKHAMILETSELQFGFKNKHSTVQCTFVYNEIVQLYTSQGSRCYTVLLDATKAFDRVDFVKLFTLLFERSMCPTVIKLLVFMYTHQCLNVRWQTVTTRSFSCSNGIKQGAVLSPILFCLYMDEVLTRLKTLGVGCYFGSTYAGALCYADDLCLLAPSRGAAQQMLTVCEKFANDFNVSFNSKKSKIIVHDPVRASVNDASPVPLTLCGASIEFSKCELYLGNLVGENSNTKSIDRAVQDLNYRTNLLMSRFSFCPVNVRLKLFNSYCTSFYGSPLYSLSANFRSFQKLNVSYKKCIKKVMKLDVCTKSKLIAPLTHKPEFRIQLLTRLCKFLKNCLTSDNPLLHTVSMCCYNSFSTVGQNFRDLLGFLKLNFNLFVSLPLSHLMNYFENAQACTPDSDVARCIAILELSQVLDGTLSLLTLERREVRLLLDYLCTYS